MIQIISVGKRHQPWLQPGLDRYSKRLRRPYDVQWEFIASSSLDGASARQEESTRLLRRLPESGYVVLLDETGQLLNSKQLAAKLQQQHDYGVPITVIIGGAYGVDETVHRRADLVWSLSPLVLPHQLVRLVLVEQIYRSQQINAGSQYHHE